MSAQGAAIDAAVRARLAGRPVVLVARVPEKLPAALETLEAAGAGPVLALCLRDGAGHAGVPLVTLATGPRDPDFVLECARLEAHAADLPPAAAAALAAFDPEGRAVVIASHHLRLAGVAGRPCVGGSLVGRDLEDKTTIDALWDAVGVTRLPSRVVEMAPGPLLAAVRALDAGDGVVVAGDNASALEGGALTTRWVHDAATARAAGALLSGRCRRVRVTPFAEGVPISIHGWCLARGVAVLRPMEMVVLRDRPAGRFWFCGAATTWDPPDADRAALRLLARRVALHLRARVGYRGAFSIDGILTADGFVPTELNARYAAGLHRIGDLAPELRLGLVDMLVRDGGLTELDPAAFEAELLRIADGRRLQWLTASTPEAPEADHSIGLVRADGGLRRAPPGAPADLHLRWTRQPTGGVIRVEEAAPAPGPLGVTTLLQAIAAAGPPLTGQLGGLTGPRR